MARMKWIETWKKLLVPLHVLANFITCLPPVIPRDIALFPSILKNMQRWRVLWIGSVNGLSTDLTLLESPFKRYQCVCTIASDSIAGVARPTSALESSKCVLTSDSRCREITVVQRRILAFVYVWKWGRFLSFLIKRKSNKLLQNYRDNKSQKKH